MPETISFLSGKDAIPVSLLNPLPTTGSGADVVPSTVNITTQDLVSSSTTVANGQVFITGTPTSGSAASFALSSVQTCGVQVTGTWTGTLAIETSFDGTTWVSRSLHQGGTASFSTSFTANFSGLVNVTGRAYMRVRATAAMTGTAVVKVVESENEGIVYVASLQTPTYTSTDRSSTITLGGTAQNVMAANTARKGWSITNLSTVAMYVNDTGSAATATNGTIINAGQTVDDGGRPSTAAISVLCATTSSVFSAKEYT